MKSLVLHGNSRIHYVGLRALARMLEVNQQITLLGVKDLHQEAEEHLIEAMIVPGLEKNRKIRDRKCVLA